MNVRKLQANDKLQNGSNIVEQPILNTYKTKKMNIGKQIYLFKKYSTVNLIIIDALYCHNSIKFKIFSQNVTKLHENFHTFIICTYR